MRRAHWPRLLLHESDAVEDIRTWLLFRGAAAYKTHDAHHRPAHPGIADLVLCWPAKITQAMVGRIMGLFGVVEAKSQEALTWECAADRLQREFLADVATHSGIVIKASSWEDVERALRIRALL